MAYRIGCIGLFLLLASCGKNKPGPQPWPNQQPEPEQSKSGFYCNDLLVADQGYVFKVDQKTLQATILPNGIYGFDSYTNGWGTTIPGCHYQVSNGDIESLP